MYRPAAGKIRSPVLLCYFCFPVLPRLVQIGRYRLAADESVATRAGAGVGRAAEARVDSDHMRSHVEEMTGCTFDFCFIVGVWHVRSDMNEHT